MIKRLIDWLSVKVQQLVGTGIWWDVTTWLGHSLATAGCVILGSWLLGSWGAWLGFVLGAEFYAARETRPWDGRAQLDHFGDVSGPIVLGSLALKLLIG